jgi:hypothetical protein
VIGSGFPHLEEAYRVAELLFPLLQRSSPDVLRVETPAGRYSGGGSLSGEHALVGRDVARVPAGATK